MIEKRIEVRRFHKFWNIAIFTNAFGQAPKFPRVRTASSKSSLNRILRDEDISHHPQFGDVKTEVVHLDKRG